MSVPDHRGLPPSDGFPAGGPSPSGRSGCRWPVVLAGLAVLAVLGGAAGFLAIASFDSRFDEWATTTARPRPEPTAAPVPTSAPAPAPVTSPPTTVPVDLFAGTAAADVVQAMADRQGGGPLRLLEVSLYPTYAFLAVQDPAVPAHVDRHPWRDGALQDPEPVRLGGVSDLEAALFGAAEVDWTAVPALVASAPGATGITDGRVSHVIVKRALPFRPDVVIRVYVTSDRAGGYVEADATGAVVRVVT